MSITITIGGQEAIPLRAIPFITGGEMPPSQVASVLAHDDLYFQTIKGVPIALTAYIFHNDGGYSPILTKEWDYVVIDLDSLSANLEAGAWDRASTIARPMPSSDGTLIPDGRDDRFALSPEEIMQLLAAIVDDPGENIRHEARRLSRQEWQLESLKKLPASCFVWLNEFEQAFHQVYDRLEIIGEKLGDRDLNYAPMALVDDKLRGIVLEGFVNQTPANDCAAMIGLVGAKEIKTGQMLGNPDAEDAATIAQVDAGIKSNDRKLKSKSLNTFINHQNESVTTDASPDDADNDMEKLFNPVSAAALEKMFPDDGCWGKYAERAKRNGLIPARNGRAKFNPYRAAIWWLDKKKPVGWDMARCRRTLANNLPSRSIDSKHFLTGELE